MKIIITITSITFLLFSCSSNKEMVNYLRECKELTPDNHGFVLVERDELRKNLKGDEILRYVGSNNEVHYFIHYYDKTVKIQSKFKLEGNIGGIKQKIDVWDNLLHEEEHGKFKDSYYIALSKI